MSKGKSIQNLKWEEIFKDYPIIVAVKDEGYFRITSSQINCYHEARLMTKFDFQDQLPKIFKDNGLAILPITRGSYVIGKFNLFEKIVNTKNIKTIGAKKPDYIESIDIENISSETTALLCANICEILTSFFEEENITHVIGGRMGSGDFDFEISNLKIEVSKSQIEIDGGFESETSIYLVEVKNLIHDDFLIRQVYYPYRVWTKKLEERSINKKVRNIFLTYSDGIFHLREYVFKNINKPDSIEMIREGKYSIVKDSLSLERLQNIVNDAIFVKEPYVPFPQSNDIDKTINLCELLYYKNAEMSKEEIAEEFRFVPRQADYYGNSAKYFGLVNYSNDKKYSLTSLGKNILGKPIEQRQFDLVSLIMKYKPFNLVMKSYLDNGSCPSVDEVKLLIKDCDLHGVGKDTTTFGRRCSTVISWTNWILDRVEI
ncbi:hypothetical protein [Psychrobacter sp. Ps6]|uniref:type II restriction enzyme n=1 Tax=Psychrobacter sp. Ps6 TaxID=2790960 RepID=UPI001EE097FB|nr:hypothetical protein [Psychrobacter sp. Ps6]MCG3878114.1 transcriptional regulator [Psychrobacter sp. Ps6]